MNKRFTIIMLLMALFVPWTAKAQETKTIQVAPDRGGDRGSMTVYKRVSSLTSGRNYLIVSSATANSDALALSQTSSTNENITAAFVHINSGISATGNAAYIANLADPTAVWKATSGWTFSHTKNSSTYYIYTDGNTLSASTSSTNWTYSNNSLYYHYELSFWGIVISSTDYYITPSSSGFGLAEDEEANVYLFEETSVTAYDVTASVSPAGIGRVTGAGQYPAGATCTLSASTINSEFAFSNWTVNGTVVSTSPTFNFTVSEDFDVVANFESSVTCPSPTNLTAGTPYAHSVPLTWTSTADNFNVRYRTIGTGETQTFFDGFENGLGSWTVIRNGGGDNSSGTDWAQNSPNFSSGNVSPHTGTYVAMSRSWNNSAYSVDNWLITPQVTLDGTLKFWALDDGRYHEHYDVYVSTTGNSLTDFSLYYEPGNASDTWTQVTVDLSSFNGASGYIALRHTDTDQDYLLIDDFGIYAQSYGEWSQLIPVDGTSFTLTGLESQTAYQVEVQANCGDELSGWSNRVNFTTSTPSTAAPTNLSVDVNSITNNSATVSWQGVTANDSHQYYEVYYAESNVTSVPSSPAEPYLIDSITETTYTFTGLTPETEYHVWVRDYCGEDGYSPWTSYQTFTTLVSCPKPTNFISSNVTGHTATLSWNENGTTTNWILEYGTASDFIGATSVNVSDTASVQLTDLNGETTYYARVKADCGDGDESNWVTASFITDITCPAPTELAVIENSVTGHTATISWTDASDSLIYYQVYYAESNVTSVPDSIAAPNLIDSISTSSYTLSGLHSETEYHVWVRAYCGEDDGYSDWTSYQTFTTLESCFPPTDITITNETGHGATIEWNGTSDSYLVMVSESEQGSYSYDFEDGTSQGWTILKGNEGSSPNNWMHSSQYSAYDSNNALIVPECHNSSSGMMLSESYISAATAGATPYGAVTPDNYLVSPRIRLGGSITFYAASRMSNYPAEKFSVMISESGNNSVSDFTHTVLTVTLTDNSWHEYTVDLSAYSGWGYVAIRHYDCYDQHLLYIDDITIENGPVDPSWMTYEAEASPFVLYDVTNIHPESTYSVKVIGVCDDEQSHPSATTSFTTTIACPAPTDLAVIENSITGRGATLEWEGNSESYVVSYRTPSGTNVLLEENFENEDSFSNWTFTSMNTANNIASGYAGRNANAAHSGSFGFRFSSFSTADDYNQYLVSPRLTRTGELKFYYKKYNTNNTESLKVGYSTTTNDIDAFTWTSLSLTTEWQSYTHEIAENVKYIAFHYYGDYAYYVYVDDITISEYVPAGIWQTITVTEPTATLTSLVSETTYEVVVQSNCGDDGLSAESNSVTFTTLVSCPAPTPLDPTDVTSSSAVLNWAGDAESYNVSYYKAFFFESFEEGLDQWTIYKEGDANSYEWYMENPTGLSSDLHAHSGYYTALAASDIGVHADNWLISPQIQFPTQTTLKFWVMRSTYDSAKDEYEVLLSTTGNAIENFTETIKGKEAANSSWTEVSIDLSEYDGQQCYIAIHHDYTGGFFIMVDDFGIYGWSQPIVTTDNSLLIEDLLPETEYQWQVQANCGDEDGLSRWSEISTLTTLRACPIPFYLEAYDETAYGATLAWTGYNDSYVIMVKENEDEEAHSYSYDFEDGTLQGWTLLKGNEGTSPNNWMHVYEYPTSANDLSSGHGHNSSDGFMLSESFIYGETQTIGTAVTPDNYLVSPQVWLGGSITFYVGIQDVDFDAEKFSVMVSTTGNDAVSDFTTVQTWTFTHTASSGSEWQEFTVDLSAFSGKGYIAIRHFDSRDQWMLCIDDITIESGPVIPTWFTYESEASPFILYDPEHLSAETTYLVKVKGFCDEEATGFSESITFTTLDENTKIFVTEGDWSDGDNWVPVGVPSIDQDVILRAEATVFDVAEADSISIEGTATLTIEDGGQLKTNSDVEATMKKFIIGYGTDYVETTDGYYLMALPTAAPIHADSAGLMTEESDYDLYSWNRTATDEEWQNKHDSLSIENGQGFLYANQGDMEMSFTATLRNSAESITLTAEYDEVEHGGWSLYGNPFPCEAYITTEAEDMTFYRLVGNELVPVEGAIAPLEAFFVKATAEGQTFTISREAPEER